MRQSLLIVLIVFSLGCSRMGQQVEDGGVLMPTDQPVLPATEQVQTAGEVEFSCNEPDGWWSTAALGDTLWDHAIFGPGEDSILVLGPGDQSSEIDLEAPNDMHQITNRRYETFKLSPDGKHLVGTIPGPEQYEGELVLVDLLTGAEELLNVSAYGVLAWVDSGESLIIATKESGHELWLRKLNLASGATEDLVLATDAWQEGEWPYGEPVMEVKTGVISQQPHRDGSLSPDGQQLLFVAGSHLSRVFRLDLRTGSLYTYPETETDGHSVHWAPDGRRAYFGYPGIRILDTVTGEVELYKPYPLVDRITDVASDGRILAYTLRCWVVGTLDSATK